MYDVNNRLKLGDFVKIVYNYIDLNHPYTALSLIGIYDHLMPHSKKLFKYNIDVLKSICNIEEFKYNSLLCLLIHLYDNDNYLLVVLKKILDSIDRDIYFEYIPGDSEKSLLLVYFRLNKSINFIDAMKEIFYKTNLFDINFYRNQYGLYSNNIDVIDHFINYGFEKGYLPASWYDIERCENVNKLESCSNKNSINNNPLVSVIIPVYNNSLYLVECLESIINQSLKNIEIIIIDDGSTDLVTKNVLKRYHDEDPRVILISKKNTGYGHSCNCGLLAAKGKYIAIVESDDFIVLDMYEKLVKIADDTNVEIVSVIIKTFIGEGEDRKYTDIEIDKRYNNKIVFPQDNPDVLRAPNIVINQPSITLRKFMVDNNIYFNESPGASFQDVGVFWKRYFYAKKIYYCNEYLYMLRRDNPDSSSVNKGKVLSHTFEYALIENVIRSNPNLESKLICYFQNKKLGASEWHLTRIREEAKPILYEYIGMQYNLALQQHEIDFTLVSTARQKIYRKYYEQYCRKNKLAVIYIGNLLYGGLERSASILSFALRDIGFDVHFFINDKYHASSYKFFGTVSTYNSDYKSYDILKRAEVIFDFKFKNNMEDSFVDTCIQYFISKYIPTIHNSGDRVKFYFDLVYKLLNKYKKNPDHLKSIVCCGKIVMDDFIKKYGNYSNLLVIYNSFLPKYTVKKNNKYADYILFVGRKDAIHVKGIDLLLKAYSQSTLPENNVKLLMIGHGKVDDKLIDKFANNYAIDSIIDLPFTCDIDEFYQNAICTVLPSRQEGFSMTIIESLACGTPVIASKVGGADEVIEHSVNGYIFENARIADLTYYLNNIQYTSDQMKHFCKDSVKRYDFSTYTQRVANLLNIEFKILK